MTDWSLFANAVTAAATLALAVAAWVEFPLISKQVRGLAEQIEASREADKNADRRTREWNTLAACQRYDFDPVIEAATARIWEASNKGTDYRSNVERRDIVVLLNYLDGLAIGIDQDLYIDQIVKDHLAPMFEHATVCLLDTQIVSITGFERVKQTHLRWTAAAAYRSER